jgi:hypothetical protein
MKKKLLVGILSLGLIAVPSVVNAQGTATIRFEGNNEVTKGKVVRVDIIVDDVKDTNDGIHAFGGYINYDNSVLELVSSKEADNNYPVYINKDNKKIAALDYYLDNGINNKTNVYTLYFRATGEGNTTITLTNPEVVDINSKVDSKIEGLNLSVKEEKKEVVTTTTAPKTTTTTTTTKPTTTTTSRVEVKTTEATTKAKVEETTTKVVEDQKETEEVKEENIIVKFFNTIIDFFKNLVK